MAILFTSALMNKKLHLIKSSVWSSTVGFGWRKKRNYKANDSQLANCNENNNFTVNCTKSGIHWRFRKDWEPSALDDCATSSPSELTWVSLFDSIQFKVSVISIFLKKWGIDWCATCFLQGKCVVPFRFGWYSGHRCSLSASCEASDPFCRQITIVCTLTANGSKKEK